MNRSEFEKIAADTYAETAERPFADDQSIVVFRHSGNRKWFAVIMTVPKIKLGILGEGTVDIVNLKCDEGVSYSVLQEEGIYPAYHMNKRHWISVLLDGSVDDDTVLWLLDISHILTSTKIKPNKIKDPTDF